MEFLILLGIAAALAAGIGWSRKRFRPEIERTKRIRRANREDRP
ncbi:hypothetical protein N2K95_12670 [Arthrobacter zhaoxinii]|uniref:Cell division protein ZipA n=1 Tax=Arthrobacter zhaoxinii TaxID=2964616 RepID=A0ABY5YN32_9MICC|nr:hypothetical protein [Arthrobacter zhaoxinii]UWX96506.1 hypothetical protein N2K95_12670 [Arthrobacter zhaoxinii]